MQYRISKLFPPYDFAHVLMELEGGVSALAVFEYEEIANNILTGDGFRYNFYGVEYRSFVQPFYPIFTALVYYLTNHSYIAMLIIQSIVSSLLCLSVYFIAILLKSPYHFSFASRSSDETASS